MAAKHYIWNRIIRDDTTIKVKSPRRFLLVALIALILLVCSILYVRTSVTAENTNLREYTVTQGDKGELIYNKFASNEYLPDEFYYNVEMLSGIKSIGDLKPGQKLILPDKMLKPNVKLPIVRDKRLASRSDTRVIRMTSTAYTHTGHKTKSETWPHVGTVAVDPEVIPLGTKLYVEGYGEAYAWDTGRLIQGNKIDLFMDSEAECKAYGRKQVEVRVID